MQFNALQSAEESILKGIEDSYEGGSSKIKRNGRDNLNSINSKEANYKPGSDIHDSHNKDS